MIKKFGCVLAGMLVLAGSWRDVAAQVQDETVVIRDNSSWRYLDDGSDQGVAWRALDFDDSAWSQGQAPLGYGELDFDGQLSFGGDRSHRYITYYFRHSFGSIRVSQRELRPFQGRDGSPATR
jgi:hypothetical protein